MPRDEEEILIDLSLQTRSEGDWTVVTVEGELDLYTAPQLRERVLELSEEGRARVAIDLERVGFIDSSGLGVIVGQNKRAREEGFRFAVAVSGAREVERILQLSGLTASLDIQPSPDEILG
jgi:anti-sigma B factor antagonist